MIENIKKWIEKCVYDANEILFGKTLLSKYINRVQTEFESLSNINCC